MAKDPEENSEYSDQIEAEDHGQAEHHEQDEEDADIPERPVCPNCGWRNTRPSHSRTFLDTVLRMLSVRPYRCRSCGNRFRVMRRGSDV